jgi:transposase
LAHFPSLRGPGHGAIGFFWFGKGIDTLERFRTHLTSKGVAAQQIEEVCCDMSPAFIRGVEDYFPDAEITFDKFHVMKLVGNG